MMKNRKSRLYNVLPLYLLFKLQESYESFFTFSTISSTSERLTFYRPSSIAFKVRFAKAIGILQNRIIVLVSMEAIYCTNYIIIIKYNVKLLSRDKITGIKRTELSWY